MKYADRIKLMMVISFTEYYVTGEPFKRVTDCKEHGIAPIRKHKLCGKRAAILSKRAVRVRYILDCFEIYGIFLWDVRIF